MINYNYVHIVKLSVKTNSKQVRDVMEAMEKLLREAEKQQVEGGPIELDSVSATYSEKQPFEVTVTWTEEHPNSVEVERTYEPERVAAEQDA